MNDKQRLAVLIPLVNIMTEDSELLTEENCLEIESFGDDFLNITQKVTNKKISKELENEMELLVIQNMMKEIKYFTEKYK